MRVMTLALCGALLTVAGVSSSEAQTRQVSADRVKANMNRGMSGGMFSLSQKKPTRMVAQDAPASPSGPVVQRIGVDGGPMVAPTYRLPNGVVLQASWGINPADGVTCIAYCRPEAETSRMRTEAHAR